jgi:hypothetical protein
MKQVISISEAVAEFALPLGGVGEVHVSIDGSHDPERELLVASLDCELRATGTPVPPERPAWLPAHELIKQHVGADEATTLARDIFHHWVEKVRRAIPVDLAWPIVHR